MDDKEFRSRVSSLLYNTVYQSEKVRDNLHSILKELYPSHTDNTIFEIRDAILLKWKGE